MKGLRNEQTCALNKGERNVARIGETQIESKQHLPGPGIELFGLREAGNATREKAAA